MEINWTPPGPVAAAFMRSEAFVRGLMGPVGCVSGDTLVVTEYGVIPISDIDRPMRVLSWNDKTNQFQLSWCGGSFPKGIDYLHQISTPHGEFAASGHHQTYGAQRSYRRVDGLACGDVLLRCSDVLGVTSVLVSRLLSGEGVPHSIQKAVNYLGDYAALARQYGQRFLTGEGSVQASVPLRGGVRKLILFGGLSLAARMGDRWERLRERIRHGLSAVLWRIGGSSLRFVPHNWVLEGFSEKSPFGYSVGKPGPSGLSRLMSALHLRAELSSGCFGSCVGSISEGAIKRVRREAVKRAYWDMQVLDTNNYVTVDGTIHHNSGKSTACVFEILKRAMTMSPGVDGKRRSRWIVARNTYPELKTTTIPTWHQWVPSTMGRWIGEGPPRHIIETPDLEIEVVFLSLDKADDIKKLLSFEVTGIWLNEARELPFSVLEGASSRVGRFTKGLAPGQQSSWAGVIMDTNPPDTDHWWYTLAERATDTDRRREIVNSISETEDGLRSLGLLGQDQPLYEFFRQPGGLSEGAENEEGLAKVPGGRKSYYMKASAGKSDAWRRIYIDGEYGYIQDGKPVYPEYRDSEHCGETVIAPRVPVHIGMDFGLTPAAVFGQRIPSGQWLVHRELVNDRASLAEFARQILRMYNDEFKDCPIGSITGDPSGQAGQAGDESARNVFEILKASGLRAKPAPSNDPTLRIESVARVLRVRDGFKMNPKCRVLRKGFIGAYRYRRMRTSGDRYEEKPEKNDVSHVHDAGQYMLLGAGEGRVLMRADTGLYMPDGTKYIRPTRVRTEYDEFGG